MGVDFFHASTQVPDLIGMFHILKDSPLIFIHPSKSVIIESKVFTFHTHLFTVTIMPCDGIDPIVTTFSACDKGLAEEQGSPFSKRLECGVKGRRAALAMSLAIKRRSLSSLYGQSQMTAMFHLDSLDWFRVRCGGSCGE